ncbi:MAG: hypothetical protein SF187_17345 [Deltaproteobacteria bacterium]|nr:hypothetical protein [Deltaproteobacteria bacterium]
MPLFARSDGELVHTETPVRSILPYVMRGRNESAIYHQETYDITRTRSWLRQFNRARGNKLPASLFHLFLFACAQGLHRRPELNRFVSGGRLYRRKGVFISFAAKKAFKDDAPLVTIKLSFPEIESFEHAVDRINEAIMQGRGDRSTTVDKELALAMALPRWLLRAVMALLRWLDGMNLKPRFMIESDPLYTSLFVANLGSVGLDRVFHHLYEDGTASVFGALGVPRKATALDRHGRVQTHDEVEVRWTLDERVADAFYCAASLKIARRIIEDPARHFGAENMTLPAVEEAALVSG